MITINGKTYKQLHNKYSIEWLVKHGYMEEVKEKPLSQKRAEAIERGKEITILEKLREWVDKELKLDGYEHQQILDKIDLLTSLETSPISKTETTQFTPGQEIEVSDDGIDWVHSKFVDMYEGKYRVNNTSEDFPSMRTYWNNARPIKIEPELPTIEPISMAYQDYYEGQQSIKNKLNELVAGYQALARQKTTK